MLQQLEVKVLLKLDLALLIDQMQPKVNMKLSVRVYKNKR